MRGIALIGLVASLIVTGFIVKKNNATTKKLRAKVHAALNTLDFSKDEAKSLSEKDEGMKAVTDVKSENDTERLKNHIQNQIDERTRMIEQATGVSVQN